MPREKTNTDSTAQATWWSEYEFLNPGIKLSLKMKLLHEEKTPFQKLEIYDHKYLGRVLVLDSVVQTTEEDEFIYHEMLTHVPLMGRKNAGKESSSVLIIGGGDGGMLREVLKHKWVSRVVMVELDQAVVTSCEKFLGFNGDYNDSRVKLIFGDGAAYVASEEAKNNPFDVVIIDSTDPIGPGEILFSEEFCQNVHSCLTPTGVMARHLGVMAFQKSVMPDGHKKLTKIFGNAQAFRAAVPTYIGADMVFMLASKDNHDCRKPCLEFSGKYYNPDVHSASFALPTWWQDSLSS